jgi:hypothetical protein
MVSCFFLKEKLLCFDDLPLLSAADIRDWLFFKFFQTRTDEEMIELMFFELYRILYHKACIVSQKVQPFVNQFSSRWRLPCV